MAVAVALGLAALYVVNQPSTFTASAVVLLAPAPGNPLTAEAASGSGMQTTVAMSTEAELVRTPAVREVVANDVGRLMPDENERLEIVIPTNTQMLEISFTSGSAAHAQEGAQGFAEGYLAFRGERATTTQEARTKSLGDQITAADSNLRRAASEAAGANAGSFASQEVQLYTDRLAQLNTSLSAAQAVSTAPGSVIAPAVFPTGANELSPWLYYSAAALLGLIAGFGVAILREWRRDLVRNTDAPAEMGVPVFSTIPGSGASELTVTDDSNTALEAYRRLRAAVIANAPAPHVLAVAAVDEEPSFGVASNLAIVLAEARFSVLLIETDPQESEMAGRMRVEGTPGLAEAIRGTDAAEDLLVEAHGVSVLTSGSSPAWSGDLTASPAFREMVTRLHGDFDYVVLDAAAAGSAEGDAVLLAAHSVLLVLTSDRTTRARLNAALERFDRLAIKTLGAIKVARAKGSSERRRTAALASSSQRASTESSGTRS